MAADGEMKPGPWSGQDGVDPLSNDLNKSLLWDGSCGIKEHWETLSITYDWCKYGKDAGGGGGGGRTGNGLLGIFQASPTVLFSLSGGVLSRIFCTSVGGTCTQTWHCPSLTVRTTGLETHGWLLFKHWQRWLERMEKEKQRNAVWF